MTQLIMGCAQLGMSYGIANRTGQPSRSEAIALVHQALNAGVTAFDTAPSYGDSEEILGLALEGVDAKIYTKLKIPDWVKTGPDQYAGENVTAQMLLDVRVAVAQSVETSLRALKRDKIDCVQMHRVHDALRWCGAAWNHLRELKRGGVISALGISVESQDGLAAIADLPDLDVVQLPFNILDYRWGNWGLLSHLKARGVRINVRSVFLQGLLTADDPDRWPNVLDTAGKPAHQDPVYTIRRVSEYASAMGRKNNADLCLAYARGQGWADGVLIGMETAAQLEANIELWERYPLSFKECLRMEAGRPHVPAELLNPANWTART